MGRTWNLFSVKVRGTRTYRSQWAVKGFGEKTWRKKIALKTYTLLSSSTASRQISAYRSKKKLNILCREKRTLYAEHTCCQVLRLSQAITELQSRWSDVCTMLHWRSSPKSAEPSRAYKIGADKAYFSYGCNCNYIYSCTVKPYDILKVKNALAKSLYYVTEYTTVTVPVTAKAI